jgi:sporulation protein YlmC with PRC-barrel domain
MRRDVLDVALEVLDHEVVDVSGVPCGVVDDVELAGGAGKPLRAVALLIGPGAVATRFPWPFNTLVRRMFGGSQVRVPWAQIADVAERITLRETAQSYGLGVLDRKLGRILSRIPGSSRA